MTQYSEMRKVSAGGLSCSALACVVLLVAPAARAQTNAAADLSWSSVNSGGASFSGNGQVLLGQTVTQAADQETSRPGLILVSGFWAGASTDCNNNNFDDAFDLSSGVSQDCNTNGFPDECEESWWIGPDGGAFTNPAYWQAQDRLGSGGDPSGLPQSSAVLRNASGADNRCILNDPFVRHDVCLLTIEATGTGRQSLQINRDSLLNAISGTHINAGGELRLRGGELTGGELINAGNTITGHGVISASVQNHGAIRCESSDGHILRFAGAAFDNLSSGSVQVTIGTILHVESGTVTQAGEIEARVNASIQYDAAVTNQTNGLIRLLGGAFHASGLTNAAGGDVTGFGTLDTSVINGGQMVVIADMQIVGDLVNNGTIIVQSGILTVTGNLSGSGTIIGGFGG